MARSNLVDYLQDYAFWLFDVPHIDAGSIPIFTPLSGFSQISMPEVTLEHEEIKEGNWFYKHHVIKTAEVSSITLSRGVTLANADFNRWTMAALRGNTHLTDGPNLRIGGLTPRRQLVLIQFLSRLPYDPLGATAATSAVSLGLNPIGLEFALRIPARAFVLTGCIPTRYKPGSDLDASSSAVSISELEVSFEYFEEFALGA